VSKISLHPDDQAPKLDHFRIWHAKNPCPPHPGHFNHIAPEKRHHPGSRGKKLGLCVQNFAVFAPLRETFAAVLQSKDPMSDRLYLSCWVRGYSDFTMLRHYAKLLETFPFSKLSQRPQTLRRVRWTV